MLRPCVVREFVLVPGSDREVVCVCVCVCVRVRCKCECAYVIEAGQGLHVCTFTCVLAVPSGLLYSAGVPPDSQQSSLDNNNPLELPPPIPLLGLKNAPKLSFATTQTATQVSVRCRSSTMSDVCTHVLNALSPESLEKLMPRLFRSASSQ